MNDMPHEVLQLIFQHLCNSYGNDYKANLRTLIALRDVSATCQLWRKSILSLGIRKRYVEHDPASIFFRVYTACGWHQRSKSPGAGEKVDGIKSAYASTMVEVNNKISTRWKSISCHSEGQAKDAKMACDRRCHA